MKNTTLSKLLVPGLIFGAAIVAGAGLAFAWTGPSTTPPNGNVSAPINIGSGSQIKSGALEVNGFINDGNGINAGWLSVSKASSPSYPLDVSGTVNASAYCISGGNCISSWPSGGGGSGTVTSVSPGTGMSFSTITSSGSVSLNTANISSCTNSTSNKIYWNGSSLACGTDQTGSYTDTDTLDTVISRGSSTSRQPSFSGGVSSNQYCLNGNCITSWPGNSSTPTLDQVLAAGASTSRSPSFNGGINMGSGTVISGSGRLHISAGEVLYLLPTSGVTIGKEWGGTGSLHVEGDITTDGSNYANGFYYNSDRNLKTNIQPLQDSLDKVLKLQGVSFNWKSTGAAADGLIAQDVEQVYPELVHTDSKTGLKSVEYGNLVAPLIEAVKAQQQEIDQLKARINELEASK